MRGKVLLVTALAALLAAPGCTGTGLVPLRAWGATPSAGLRCATPPSLPVRVPLRTVEGGDAFYLGATRAARGWKVLAPRRLPEGFVLDAQASRFHAAGLHAVYRSGGALIDIREGLAAMGDVGDDPNAGKTPFGPFPGTFFIHETGPGGRRGYAVASDPGPGHYYLGCYLLPPEQLREIAASMADVR